MNRPMLLARVLSQDVSEYYHHLTKTVNVLDENCTCPDSHRILDGSRVPDSLGTFTVTDGSPSFEWRSPLFRKTFDSCYRSYADRWNRDKIYFRLLDARYRNIVTRSLIDILMDLQEPYFRTRNPVHLRSVTLEDLIPKLRERTDLRSSFDHGSLSRLTRSCRVEWKDRNWRLSEFLPSTRDVLKHTLHRLVEEEKERIFEGDLPSAHTDQQLAALLERRWDLSASRRNVSHCRNDLNIPGSRERTNRYEEGLSLFFSELLPYDHGTVNERLDDRPGIYEIHVPFDIRYPSGKTSLVYIGGSNDLKRRLRSHLRHSSNDRLRKLIATTYGHFRYSTANRYEWREDEVTHFNQFVSIYDDYPSCNTLQPYA